jgi:hypothetical protein
VSDFCVAVLFSVKFRIQDEENKMLPKKCALFVLSLFLLFLAGCNQDKRDDVTPGQTQEVASEPESQGGSATPEETQESASGREKWGVEEYTKAIERQNKALMEKTQEMMVISGGADRNNLSVIKNLSNEIYALSEEVAKLQIGQHEKLLANSGLTEARRSALQENLPLLRELIQIIQQIKPLTDAIFVEAENPSPDTGKIGDLQKQTFPLTNRLQEIGLKVQGNLMVP